MEKATNMTSEAVAKISVEGILKEKPKIITCLLNKIGVLLVWLLPKKVIEKSVADIYGF